MTIRTTLAIVLPLIALNLHGGQGETPPKLEPTETRVAILPTINQSGEKWKQLRERQEKAADEWLAKEFKDRGFKLIEVEGVKKAIADSKIDFTDEESVNREAIRQIGKLAGADVVVLSAVINTRQDGASFGQTGYGVTEMKTWVLGVSGANYLSAAKFSARSARASVKTSDRQVWAVALALGDTFKDFFAAHPKKGS